ncbi:Junction-mediating and -regulatory protein [Merluccius polli]|uniref:Junction-mediating and -regulatory protein n=1 Tax=Merluccius polli TaxID=89951 RepID=A0AA47P5M8_MERPO|nr:Junction-mediating and -regulatory protein [Merluccius polli]
MIITIIISSSSIGGGGEEERKRDGDQLECGWVAVRPHVFEEKEKHKFAFIVAWNEEEARFALTCHNRTAQRRSFGRDPCSSVDPAGQGGEKTKWPKSPVRERAAAAGSPGRGSPSKSRTPYRASPVSPDGGDAEPLSPSWDRRTLDPEEEEEEEDLSRDGLGSGREDCSWAGLFSIRDLRAVHLQLCSVNSELEACLPILPVPEEPAGTWTALFGAAPPPQVETDELCRRLRAYLGHALDACGWRILSRVLFTDHDDPDEYYESLSELRQSGYEEAVGRAKRRLNELLEQHKSMESMVELLAVYEEEDQAYGNLLEACTQLYQYLLQPFRDMRELAMLRRQQIKISMENDYLGPRRVEALKKEDSDWQKKAQEAVLNIQEFTVKYFEITARAQKGVYDRMKTDQRKFGKAAWAAAVERMERVRYSVAKETLQLQRAREICLEQRKHALMEEMQRLRSGADALARLDSLEEQYYALQLRLYSIQAEILQCEELLLTAQLDSVRRQMAERQDEVVYYDTFECPEAIGEVDTADREELRRLQTSARQLEARRGRISTKRAYLKNKRVGVTRGAARDFGPHEKMPHWALPPHHHRAEIEICVSSHSEKQRKRQKDSPSTQLVQTDDEEDEDRRNSRVSQERQTTLDRLRTFKQRYPGQVILKSTRLRTSLARRGERGGAREKDPLRLSISVQTDPSPAALTTQPHTSFPSSSSPLQPPPPPLDVPSPLDLSCSPCSLLSSPVSPAPPPPPPPPPLPLHPPGEEQATPGPGEKGPGGEGPGALRVPAGALRAALLRQQPAGERQGETEEDLRAGRPEQASSPMDEVLASLKRGCFHLKKVDQRALPPAQDNGADDDANSILAQIRKGVKLRRVPRQEGREAGELPASTDPLTRSIHEALRRIKEASPDSESDEDDGGGFPCPDWES